MTVVRLVERALRVDLSRVLPHATGDAVAAVGWLWPVSMPKSGGALMHIQGYLIKTGTRLIIVDTGFGNRKQRPHNPSGHMLDLPYTRRLAEHGWPAEDVDVVVSTHLHGDHAGGSTTLVNGDWVPTFPNALYLTTAADHEYLATPPAQPRSTWNETLRAVYQDSVCPSSTPASSTSATTVIGSATRFD